MYLQKVSLQPEFLLGGGTQGSNGSAHKLLGVDLGELLQNAQRGTSILILIQEDLYIGNHTEVSHRHWNTKASIKFRAQMAMGL